MPALQRLTSPAILFYSARLPDHPGEVARGRRAAAHLAARRAAPRARVRGAPPRPGLEARHRLLGAAHRVYRGEWDDDEVRLVLSRLPEGGVFLDVGAYFGWYSLVVARERRNTRVLAFEPVPASWARLEENRRRNGLENVRAVRAALGAEEMELPPAANGGSAHLARPELERGYVNLFCRARGRAAA